MAMCPRRAARNSRMTIFWTRQIDGPYRASSRSRGGRVQEILAEVVGRDGEDQMRPNPTSRPFFGSSRQAIQVQQTLQSLESEFDLPAQAIHGEKFVGGIGLGVQGGRQHHESGGEQAARIESLALLARLAQQTLALGLRGFLGFALMTMRVRIGAPAPSTETTRS